MDTRQRGGQQHHPRQRSAMPSLDWLAEQARPASSGFGPGTVLELSVAGLWDLAQQRLDQLPIDMNPEVWKTEMEKMNDVFSALQKLEVAGVETVKPAQNEGLLEAVTRIAATLPEPRVETATNLASFTPLTGEGVSHNIALDTIRRQFWRDLSTTLAALGEKPAGTEMLDGPPIVEKPVTYERPRPAKPASAQNAPSDAPSGLYGDMPTQMRQMMAMKAYGATAAMGKRSDLAAPKMPVGTPEQLAGAPALSDEDRLYWEKCKRRLFEGLYCIHLLREKQATHVTPAKGQSLLDATKSELARHGINGVDYQPEKVDPTYPGYTGPR